MRALLIGADSTAAHAVVLMLRAGGIAVDRAVSPPDALDLLRCHTFDIVVVDFSMSNGGGCDALNRIRHLGRPVPVLALLNPKVSPFSARGAACEPDAVLVRPFDRQELIACVRALLQRARADAAEGGCVPTAEQPVQAAA